MKKTMILLILWLPIFLVACHDDNGGYDKMPAAIESFVARYWPDTAVDQCTQNATSGAWTIILHNGPTLTFDKGEEWTSIDGNGLPLSATLLYDQCPYGLYQHLSSMGYTSQVFSISRNDRLYTVQLLDSTLEYNLSNARTRSVTP